MTLKEKLDKKDICIQSNPIQSNNLCILIGNSYFPPRFNISQRNFSVIKDQNLYQHLTNISGHFSSRRPLKSFSNKILLVKNMTHALKMKFSKDVYNWRRSTFSKSSNSLFLNYLWSSSFKFSDAALSILKTSNFSLSQNV